MLRRLLLPALVSLLTLAATCDDNIFDPPDEPVLFSGVWRGDFSVERDPSAGFSATPDRRTLEVVVAEDSAGRITGAAVLRPTTTTGGTAGTPTRAFSVEGVNAFPAVVLLLQTGTLSGGGETALVFRGEFSAVDALTGRLSGEGLQEERVVLRHERRLEL